MAATRPAMSPSPASANFPVLKQDPTMKPNPHPYAIRTTSTGVLSRSNSSGHSTTAGKHHYVPMPTSPTRKREPRLQHKHSKSLNTEESYFNPSSPQPLPVPSRFLKKAYQDDLHAEEPRFVRRRAETLPSSLTSDGTPLTPVEADNLPSNPKLWTPSQLASYLHTALQTQDADHSGKSSLPASAIADIAKFIQDTKIGGRIFLRLNEADMTIMSTDVSWHDALLAASRNLRQNVLKGRIWGAGQDSPQSGAFTPALPSQSFSPLYDSYSSASSAETTDEEDLGLSKRRKVRGRVRGLVDSFERSGSFSSASDMDDEDAPQPSRSTVKKWLDVKIVPEEAAVLSPTSPTEHSIELDVPLEKPVVEEPAEEEPSVEALLAETETKSVGARAWEDFDMDAGITVKRVAEPTANDDAQRVVNLTADPNKKVHSMPRNTPVKRKQERRVVTAVFAPASDKSASPVNLSSVESAVVRDQAVLAAVENTPQDKDTLALLMAELKETRTVVEELQQRLHEVESKNSELEKFVAVQEQELTKSRDVATAEVQASTSHACPHCGTSSDLDARLSEPAALSASSLLTFGSSFLPAVVKRALPAALLPQPRSDQENARRRKRAPAAEPSSMSEVPQYVLLLGLGVCAVVLRLMLKKAVNRRT